MINFIWSKCPRCGLEFNTTTKKCMRCGQVDNTFCPSCHKVNDHYNPVVKYNIKEYVDK